MGKYDYNVVVIGGGAAGLVSSYIAAATKAKVALIEKNEMGGDCLNTGCVPSKAFLKTAKVFSYTKRAKDFGIDDLRGTVKFEHVMAHVQDVIAQISPHDSVERYTRLGVDCFQGTAHITSPHMVIVGTKKLRTRHIIIATGARPAIPDIPGLEKISYVTSHTIWQLKELPKRLLILGGGPIGCEMALGFSRLGSAVTQVEKNPDILYREDSDITRKLRSHLESESVQILTDHEPVEFGIDGDQTYLHCRYQGGRTDIPFDTVLVAVGRQANVTGFGLEELGVKLRENGTISSNPFLQTSVKNIYVCGDVTGPYQFTHVAAHQAWYACINALFSPFKKFKSRYRTIPMVTFTDPELARVGLNEKEAKAEKIAYEKTVYGIDDLDRAIIDKEAYGMVKVLTKPKTDKILGVTILGSRASDMLPEFVLAMQHGIGLNKVLSTVHAYPTFSEANKYVAGLWRKAHTPSWLLKILQWFHTWRRR